MRSNLAYLRSYDYCRTQELLTDVSK